MSMKPQLECLGIPTRTACHKKRSSSLSSIFACPPRPCRRSPLPPHGQVLDEPLAVVTPPEVTNTGPGFKIKVGYFSTKSSFWTKVTTTQPHRSKSCNPLGLMLMGCYACRLPTQVFLNDQNRLENNPDFGRIFFKAVFY